MMQIDLSKVINEKLDEMAASGVLEKAVTETVEKVVTQEVTNTINSYSFRNAIGEQVKACVSDIAKDCGLPAYNGHIALRVRNILEDLLSGDLAEKVTAAVDQVVLKRYDGIALSEIFREYAHWVNESEADEDKAEYESFTMELNVKNDYPFKRVNCRFGEKSSFEESEDTAELNFLVYEGHSANGRETMSSLYLDGHNMKESLRLGRLSRFEQLLLNLYLNQTEVLMDLDQVDADNCDYEYDFIED